MIDRKSFCLISPRIRANAIEAIRAAADGVTVTIAPKGRSGGQNDHFHAICHDLEKSGLEFAGKPRTQDEWKVLLISAHAVATQTPGEVIPGIEGEFVAIRESSARMGVARASSLIEYAHAFCSMNNVALRETGRHGFGESNAA